MACYLHLLPLIVFFTCLPMLFSADLSTSMKPIPPGSSTPAPKVKLALYYEALCPYCSAFIVNQLSTIFSDHDDGVKLIDIIDLNLVPYGNAHVFPNKTITCEHGPDECVLNTAETCAINTWPDVNKHFTFIKCVEKLVIEKRYKEFESCFVKGYDEEPVYGCYKSGLGDKLQLQYAKEMDALKPPHEYVPWVTVDGKPIRTDYKNFKTYVCDAYKGTPPKACQSPTISETVMKNPMAQVCYAKEKKSPTTTKIKFTFRGAK